MRGPCWHWPQGYRRLATVSSAWWGLKGGHVLSLGHALPMKTGLALGVHFSLWTTSRVLVYSLRQMRTQCP